MKKNQRHIYPEPSVEAAYDEQFYHDLYVEDDKIRYMLERVDLKSASSVLDIGCGRGELVFELVKQGIQSVVGIDLSEDGIKVAMEKSKKLNDSRHQVQFECMSATELEFQRNTFDLIFMADIIEHLSDEHLKQAMAEAYRVLKPGGTLVVHTEPTVNYKRVGQYFVADHFSRQGKEWITPTIEDESKMGHVNIQSKSSLQNYLADVFGKQNIHVYYAPVHTEGFRKRVISCFGLWTLFSPHLWAVAKK